MNEEPENTENIAGQALSPPSCSAIDPERAWVDYYTSLKQKDDYLRDLLITVDLDDPDDVDSVVNAFRNALGREQGQTKVHFVIFQRNISGKVCSNQQDWEPDYFRSHLEQQAQSQNHSAPDYVGSVYEKDHGDIRVLCAISREPINDHIQYADSKQGYYVHVVRGEDGKRWHEIVNRPIILQRFDKNNNTWRDCLPPSYQLVNYD